MNVYRIGKKKYIKDLSGQGARFYGGRWNYSGYRVLYASESIPLAILEYITKTGAVEEELINLSIAYIEVKDDASFSTIKIEDLPEDWNTYPVPEDLKKIGTDWIISAQSLILKVPAVSAPDSYNILINPIHPEFKKVNLLKVSEYQPDLRLRKKK